MASPPIIAFRQAVAAIQQTVASVPSISGAPPATLALLQNQTRTALSLAIQVVSYFDEAMGIVGAPANFQSGTLPAAMVVNVTALLATNARLNRYLDATNKLSRFAINLREIVSPSGALADIDHTFGNDIQVAPSGDMGIVTGWLRTAQRVIRRLCTPATKPLSQTTSLAVSPGDDLFRIAAAIYGDATGWSLIAAANGLSDPMIQTDAVLVIPAYSTARVNDGILPVPGATS